MKKKSKIIIFKTLTALVFSAFLAALSIVLGKYLAIPGGSVLRFSFENAPIIFAGMLFGPFAGALVGVVADLVGCVMVGYEINPLVTVGAALIGFISGLIFYISRRLSLTRSVSIILSVGGAHIIGSVVVKTVGLAIYYDMPLYALMLWRLLNYVIIGALEGVIIYFLMKNKLIRAEISSINKKR